MTKKGILMGYDYEPFSLQQHFFTKNGNEHNNGRREFISMWMRGALLLSVVYQHSPWIRKQLYRGRVVFPGLFTGREGSQASRLTDAMGKGSFHIILFKTQTFFMLNKCFQK